MLIISHRVKKCNGFVLVVDMELSLKGMATAWNFSLAGTGEIIRLTA